MIFFRMNIKLLIDKGSIEQKIHELAAILAVNKELNFVIVLKGAKKFANKLIKDITLISNPKISTYYITISSYKGIESTESISLRRDIDGNISGKDIIVIDDILDTGLTMDFIKRHIMEKGAKSVRVCVLLDKEKNRKYSVKPDYVGFSIESVFVIGYGLDLDGKYRDLDYIGYVS